MVQISRYTFTFDKLGEIVRNDDLGHIILGILIILAIATHLYKYKKNLGFSYWWFLVNAYLIHIYMDGLASYYQYSKTVHYMYTNMDQRFFKGDNMFIILVCLAEMFLMGPLCIIVALLYKTEKIILREVLAIALSAIHFFGTIVFVAQPISAGFIDQCGPEGCFTFTGKNIYFFWFSFVFCDSVWLFVPVREIIKSYQRLNGLLNKKKVQ